MNISKHKLRSVSLKDTLKSYRDFQKLERTGPRLLSPRTPRNRAAYVQNQFPDTEGQAAQDHDPRGKGDKRGEPWGCPPPCPEAGPTQRARGRDRGGTVPCRVEQTKAGAPGRCRSELRGCPPFPLKGETPPGRSENKGEHGEALGAGGRYGGPKGARPRAPRETVGRRPGTRPDHVGLEGRLSDWRW